MTSYQLIRSSRKTLAIEITKTGEVIVRAPRRMPLSVIEDFLQKKQGWVEEKSRTARLRWGAGEAFFLLKQESLPLLGREYPVRFEQRMKASFEQGVFYLPDIGEEAAKKALADCYRSLAKAYLPDRAFSLARQIGISPERVTVGGAKSRWGSCAEGKRIRLSWRLLLAPEEAVCYVIIHELCHCREMNHSKRFWSLVEEFCPGYQTAKELLLKTQRHPLFELLP